MEIRIKPEKQPDCEESPDRKFRVSLWGELGKKMLKTATEELQILIYLFNRQLLNTYCL